MGAWGTAIFSDDIASDVRDDFRDLIGEGLSPEAATKRLLADYASIVEDPEGGASFWLGLAVTQWKCGRLQESVKTRALEIIDSGADLRRWSHDAKLEKARRVVLAKTRVMLESPQPAPTRIPKRFVESNAWEVGELIAYRMASGKHLVFRVTGHYADKGGTRAQLDLLDYYDDTAPTFEQARRLTTRVVVGRDDVLYQPYRRFMLSATSERQIPRERLMRLGMDDAVPDPRKDPTHVLGCLWSAADAWFEKRIDRPILWRAGPGEDEYLHWKTGDVLAHQTESGTHLLFHLIGRHQGHGVDGAPVVVHLDWQGESLPTADAIASGALKPRRILAADDPLLQAAGVVSPCFGFVFVHADDDAVDASALRPIGNFPQTYELGPQTFTGYPFVSIPMVLRRLDRRQAAEAMRHTK